MKIQFIGKKNKNNNKDKNKKINNIAEMFKNYFLLLMENESFSPFSNGYKRVYCPRMKV